MNIWLESILHLCYPAYCKGCGTVIKNPTIPLCVICRFDLPLFEASSIVENEVAKTFWGRIPAQWASCFLQMKRGNSARHYLHELKYNGNKTLGVYLAKRFAEGLKQKNPTLKIDVVIPMPLHPKKQAKRGYNQCQPIADGICEVFNCERLDQVIIKTKNLSSQTSKSRLERWKNIAGSFKCIAPDQLVNKKVLLIDDVITTGATMEACALSIIHIKGIELSLAALAYAP